MKQILFVNVCVREEHSRTLRLCNTLKKNILERYPKSMVREVTLDARQIQPLDYSAVKKRDRLLQEGRFWDAAFLKARIFSEADIIIIGAPYWDLSFPALLKIYLEQISVNGITFRYGEDGRPIGLCRAKQLFYVTTAGGYVGDNLGYAYVRSLSGFFGIAGSSCIMAEGLDIVGADVEALLQQAESGMHEAVEALAM